MVKPTILFISRDPQNSAGVQRMVSIATSLDRQGFDVWANYTDSTVAPDVYPFSPIDNSPQALMERQRAAAGWLAAQVVIVDEDMPLWRIRSVVQAATRDTKSPDRKPLPIIQVVSETASEQQISDLCRKFPDAHLVAMEGVLGGEAVRAVFETIDD